MISIIVAMSPNRAIGYCGSLPWHLPKDLARFKQLTMGHAIVMGRHTFDSLPHGALPGRRNIVLSHRHDFAPANCEVYSTLEKALEACNKDEETFIIGGAEVYSSAIHLADNLYITLVDEDPNVADTFFPQINEKEWHLTKKEKHQGFSFITLKHVKNS